MDKRFLIGVCTGMAILGIVTYFPTIAEALYSIPPTVAFSNFTVANDAVVPTTSPNNITAISYKDTLIIASDGSINIAIGSYP